MKIGIISNMMMGVAGMELLLEHNKLACVAIPDFKTDANKVTKALCSRQTIPLQILEKHTYSTQLESWLNSNQPDAVITAGCPFKIPVSLLNHPRVGFWNIHPGSLPKYAGMDPVFWHVRNREEQLLITAHKMTGTLDAGPILLEIPLKIPGNQTYGQVWNQVQQLGRHVFQQLITAIQNDPPKLNKQQRINEKSYAKKPAREHMTINWRTMSAAEIRAVVDACNPNYGGAFSLFRDGFLKIMRVNVATEKTNTDPGTIIKVDKAGLWVQAKNEQAVIIKIVNMADGYLTGTDLLNMNVEVGEQFRSPN